MYARITIPSPPAASGGTRGPQLTRSHRTQPVGLELNYGIIPVSILSGQGVKCAPILSQNLAKLRQMPR